MTRLRRRLLLAAVAAIFVMQPAAARAAEDHPPVGPLSAERALDAAGDSISFAARVQSGNKLGLTLTNYGFVGTNFSSYSPSFEYPLGSGHMHMVRGGPWVGAISADENGAFYGVSIAAEDGSAGGNSASASEFTPAGNSIMARSTLPNSRFYDPDAISELDFISRFSDRPAQTQKKHRPLNLICNQYTFEWSFSDYAHFVIFHYVFHNDGPPLRKVWLGMYDELASGNMRLQSTLPPTGWFSKKYITWVDSLSMLTERYCGARNYPTACGFSVAPEIVAVKYLGVRSNGAVDTTGKQLTFQSWSYAPGSAARDVDDLKYALMSTGTRTPLVPLVDSLAPGTGDPVTLMAVGPFETVGAGDSIAIDFAYIGGLSYAELSHRATIAQRAYDLDYLVPVPPPSPRMKAVARGNAVDLYWDGSPEIFHDPTNPLPHDFEGYRVYLGESRDTLNLVAQYDLGVPPNDTTGFNTGLGPVTLPAPVDIDGVSYTYKYTLANLRDGFKYYTAITAYDLGTTEIESLESGASQNEVLVVPGPTPGERGTGVTVFPNPYRVETAWDRGQQARSHYLWFANLPQECSIHIYTLSGDLVFATEFDGRSYNGSNARGIRPPASELRTILPGSMWGWDMITREGQAVASGLYLWAVEDKHGGKRQTGKMLIVKSDREGL
jgi:hypothetical protein